MCVQVLILTYSSARDGESITRGGTAYRARVDFFFFHVAPSRAAASLVRVIYKPLAAKGIRREDVAATRGADRCRAVIDGIARMRVRGEGVHSKMWVDGERWGIRGE